MSPGHWPHARVDGTTSVENEVWVPIQNTPPVHLDDSQPLELHKFLGTRANKKFGLCMTLITFCKSTLSLLTFYGQQQRAAQATELVPLNLQEKKTALLRALAELTLPAPGR